MPSPLPITSICEQRNQLSLFNRPVSRRELVFPPSGFTTFQLDMRRKAEILKYNATKSNTKTNNPTRAQRFAQLVNNKSSQGLSQHFLKNADPAIPICPNDISLATPTSSSDVPGPVIYLHYDASVPLYNYIDNNNSLGIINGIDTLPWIVYSSNNIYFANGIDTTLLFVEFTSIVNPGTYHFNVSTPVSIYIEGNGANNPNSNIVQFRISLITASIYYSGQFVKDVPVQTAISNYLVEIDTSKFSASSFNITEYAGMLNMNGFTLSIAPGFIYEMRITFDVTVTGSTNEFVTNLHTGAYCNISSFGLSVVNGITTTSVISNDPFYPQSFQIVDY